MASAMAPLEAGRGIQVVSPGPEHTFELQLEALSELLLRDDVKDRAVVVVSVAGAFRKGKSFLLDFFLRYLHHTYGGGGGGDWLGAADAPLRGFSWRGGSERDTTGLLLWSQPFKATLDNGEKVVILLMDTQGTFDSESTVRDNATIFALSTMLSSVQIYNLSQNIEEDDLQHLQLFTEYGRLAAQSSAGPPFQRLQLLVRDWSFPYEHPYGAVGGRELLEKRLEVHEGQHEELQALRRHVASCFEELDCFLMPHPGLQVATNPHFDGKLSDISPEFLTSLRELVPRVLAPGRLAPRRLQGPLRARDLLLYFKAYTAVFNGSELPEPKTILEATAEANNLSAVAEAKEAYEAVMEAECGGGRPYLPPPRLRAEHRRARDKALHAFHAKRKMGGDELAATYEAQLLKFYNNWYQSYYYSSDGLSLNNCSIINLVTGPMGVYLNQSRVDRGLFHRYSMGRLIIPTDIERPAYLDVFFEFVNAPRRLKNRRYPFRVLATNYNYYATVYTCEYSPLIDKHFIYIWILSRTPSLNVVSYSLATKPLEKLGVDPSKLMKEDWSKCQPKYYDDLPTEPVTFRYPVPI